MTQILSVIGICQLGIAIMNSLLWFMENSGQIIRQQWNELKDSNVEAEKIAMLEAGEEVDSFEEWLANKQRLVTDKDAEVKMTFMERERYAMEILTFKGPQADEQEVLDQASGQTKVIQPFFTNWKKRAISSQALVKDGMFQQQFWQLVFAILGLMVNQLFLFFHLIDIITRFPLLQGILASITKNINQLGSVLLLIIVVVYIFSIPQFLWFFKDLKAGTGPPTGSVQLADRSLIHQAFIVLEQGMRNGGGVGDAMHDKYKTGTDGEGDLPILLAIRWTLDMAFFAIIVLILMNVLFGIIVDSFGALREEKNFQQDDSVNLCFVCNLKRDMYDRQGLVSFEQHREHEHHIWDYLQQIFHLNLKDKSRFSGVEADIFSKYNGQDISWMPIGKALSLPDQ